MNLILTREQFRQDGIFSVLRDDSGNKICDILEHAYEDIGDSYLPKLLSGTYTCVKGPHRLHGMPSDFETFEVTGVPGHSGILFHWGNYNKDSEGCLLLGNKILDLGPTPRYIVVNSRITFDKFMYSQKDCDSFTLIVR